MPTVLSVSNNVKYLEATSRGNLILNGECSNSNSGSCVDDLLTQGCLKRTEILQLLKTRFESGQIYTFVGDILLALNPFSSHFETQLYGTEKMKQLERSRDALAHIYYIAYKAIVSLQNFGISQSIVISGESGSGKTRSCQHLLSTITSYYPDSIVLKLVTCTEVILQAFGNAKTSNNKNSSRFGKYIQMFYSNSSIIGARIDHFLLERSRVLENRNNDFKPGNRAFHIFDIFLNNISLDRYFLTGAIGFSSQYTNEKAHLELIEALRKFEFFQVDSIWLNIASILHLIFISFDSYELPTSLSDVYDLLDEKSLHHFTSFSTLNMISLDTLLTSLFFKRINVKGESIPILSALSPALVKGRINSLSIEIYSLLFGNIILHMNKLLLANTDTFELFIGILDIFGFESFQTNSLEQLCINYANERLHEEYIQQVLIRIQRLYELEEIQWAPFNDDALISKVLEIIDGKFGIFNAIQEQCRLSTSPISTKQDINSLSLKIHNILSKTHSKVPSGSVFSLEHFANIVAYDCSEFVPKNRITLPDELNDILKSHFTKKNLNQSSSLIQSFQHSLNLMIAQVYKTSVHYIKCFKSNSTGIPLCFSDSTISTQLATSGIYHLIDFYLQGYPHVIKLTEFISRFHPLMILGNFTTVSLLNFFGFKDPVDYQLGISMIFLKNGIVSFLDAKTSAIITEKVRQLTCRFYYYLSTVYFGNAYLQYNRLVSVSRSFIKFQVLYVQNETMMSLFKSFYTKSICHDSISSLFYLSNFVSSTFAVYHYQLVSFRRFVAWIKSSLYALLLAEKLVLERLKFMLGRKPFIISHFQSNRAEVGVNHEYQPTSNDTTLLTQKKNITDLLRYQEEFVGLETSQSPHSKLGEEAIATGPTTIEELYLLDPIYNLHTTEVLSLDEVYQMLSDDTIESGLISNIIETLEIPLN